MAARGVPVMPKRTEEIAYDRIVHETPMAKLYDFGTEQKWVPKSLIESDDGEDGGTAEIQEWWLEQEGLL